MNVKMKLKEKIEKLRSIKNIEIIFLILIIALILFLYGLYKDYKNKSSTTSQSEVTIESDKTDAEKLEEILSKINGAGDVKVYIGYDGTETKVYAYDTTTVTTIREDDSGGANLTTTDIEETSTPTMVTENGKETPIVEKVIEPKISGVIIVAEGAKDIAVRLNLMKATAKALNIDEKIIEIFIMD